ncbi:MAG: hypothetical protein AB7O28_24435 [Vicinamibacterales bacterium]
MTPARPAAARDRLAASGWWLLAMAAAAVPAFWPRYLARPFADVDAYTHVHAAVMAVWTVLLVAQPFLSRGAGRPVHRVLGRVSFVVGPAVMLSSILLAHQRFSAMDAGTLAVEAPNLYLPLSAVAVFLPAFAGGVRLRRRSAEHARFMVCTAFPLIDPVVGRLLGIFAPPLPHPLLYQAITFGGGDLLLGALAVRDRASRAGWVLRAMLGWSVLVHAGWFTLAQRPIWRTFVQWFVSWPLTP